MFYFNLFLYFMKFKLSNICGKGHSIPSNTSLLSCARKLRCSTIFLLLMCSQVSYFVSEDSVLMPV